ncbi:sulfite oxidase [Bellilinea caldifistulae]|uniref:Protein-methionine-sulfoxide reductase catalytic subunit MsrP n=1 Tax=Bellilinea caldifistulae TaxID=360411 RepID=A0A0P6X2X2_9CHLR|nr:protein-methionine-sulfoxide reductase catalytic subunit MsrP [Bellilinea caldifistulae]KPL75424.1 sulfoxide reductase catalytic subunit YedY [Bellilinea caldifistulae]GAP09868.1 sulfite oxidase [Bellilinea caldifistulae]
MKNNTVPPIPSSEITPEHVYLNRRQFLKLAAVGAAGALLAACGIKTQSENTPGYSDSINPAERPRDERGDPANSFEEITNYNNYYEFTMDKGGVASLAKNFPTSPWQVEVSGLVHKPRIFDIEDLRQFPQEERVYRLRCVEGWSMVIPWLGFPLSLLLKEVEPMTSAAFVQFTTILDENNMPGARSPFYPWPYTEGLRLDEAYHDLTLLVTGLYGKELLPQNGAPLRLAVPWKYGFKSSKAIVRIELTETMPPTFWNRVAPNEYGFYANVNPEVPHPRWSQATERRIGENRRRETLLFNGYAEQVGQLYANMDLRVNY